ncbi:MAG: ATP-binding protein [Zetaproteobacteria bacterium]|nr:ATP-binding protein [Zetaproteobacteria bacterium]
MDKSFVKLLLKSWATIIPVIAAVVYGSYANYQGMVSLSNGLTEISQFIDKSFDLPPLIAVQDSATTSMVVDPETLMDVSEVKLEAYDETIDLLDEIAELSPDEEVKAAVENIKSIDEDKIKPLETELLEMLFEDEGKAKELFLGDYQKAKLSLHEGFNRLTETVNVYAKTQQQQALEEKRHSLVLNSTFMMVAILFVLACLFILSSRIQKGEDELNSLLGSLNEGLFYFDSTGYIPEKRSKVLELLLPGTEKFNNLKQFFCTYLGICAEKEIDAVLGLLWAEDDGFMSSFEDSISMLPSVVVRTVDGAPRILKIRYQAIYTDQAKQEGLNSVVVGLIDATENLELEKKQKEQVLRVERIEKAASNLIGFRNFSNDAILLFKSIDQMMIDQEISPVLDRDLHTLKGNLSMYGFSTIGNKIHQMEDFPDKGKNKLCAQIWEDIKSQWKYEVTDIETVLGLRNFQGKVVTDQQKIDSLKSVMEDKPEIKELVHALERVKISEALSKYADLVGRLSRKDCYKSAEVLFDEESDEVSYDEITRIDNGLIHIIRNCFDHGIEDEISRESNNKKPTGVIRISCFRKSDGSIYLVIKDDGKGIDADKLCLVASEKGILTAEECTKMSYQDKLNLVFRDSLSSKDEASELSGRGVGMSAVKSQIESLGGSITVFSHPGQGSQFKIHVPAVEVAT